MYIRNRKATFAQGALGSYKKHSNVYRPLSYYVFGGTDLSGKALADEAVSNFDSADDIEAHCAVDTLCNPRSSMFDIVEALGAEKAVELAKDVAKETTQQV